MKYRRYAEYKDSGVEWLGEVPAHWTVSVLGFESTVKARLGWKGLKAEEYVDEGYIFLATPNIKDNEIDFENVNFITQERYDESPEIMLKVGDVLVTKDGSTVGISNVVRCLPSPATVNSSIAVVRPNVELNGVFLNYLFRSSFIQNTIQRMKGGMGVPHLFQADLRKFRVLVPTYGEQSEIAAFLDDETAKIDALIAKQERLIAVLHEKRQALISHAVTKGLNPDAPMKDSGVEWLGEVPAHWEVRRNKSIYQEIDDRSTTGEEELLSVSHITGVTARSEKTVNMFMAETLENYKRCQPGDLVINTMWAYMGALGTAKIPGVVSPSYNVYRGRTLGETNPQYIDYLYRIPRHVVEVGRNSRGVWESRLRLYPDEFLDMRTPLPPRPEQEQIVEYIRQKNEQYALAERWCRHCIELLQERRAALISAAVTGKIDVQNLVSY